MTGLAAPPKHAIAMHCLRANRGLEIAYRVMEIKQCARTEGNMSIPSHSPRRRRNNTPAAAATNKVMLAGSGTTLMTPVE